MEAGDIEFMVLFCCFLVLPTMLFFGFVEWICCILEKWDKKHGRIDVSDKANDD